MKDGICNRQPVYNEIDAYACAWLRNLIRAGHLTGRVVEGDMRALNPADIGRGCHFHAFAGIGLWQYALKFAGWPDELPVWTGSCPCQPFSVAGRSGGTSDERHLWPAWFRLIRECRPHVVFGEQVASSAGLAWFDDVSADLEGEGYAVGSADLCAAGVGAPHIRQRLFFVAHASGEQCGAGRFGEAYGRQGLKPERRGEDDELGDAYGEGLSLGAWQSDGRGTVRLEGPTPVETGACSGPWADAYWLACHDPRHGRILRPAQPGAFVLAYGRAGRVAVVRPEKQGGLKVQNAHWYNRNGALRCIGNAIVPQVAAVFIEAVLRSIHDESV